MRFSLLLLALCVAFCNAALNISNTLGSDMVLQRAPLQANIWGWTDAGATVTVNFNNQNLQATADSAGEWSVLLPATKAGGPYNIGITDTTGGNVQLTNVLFGDVYICSGQSNMQFTVDQAFNHSEEVAKANNYPNIRIFSVGTHAVSLTPLYNLAQFDLGWSVAASNTVGGGNWSYMSAVCWFFGRDLYDEIQIPIGLISSNWGGTYIQAWSSPTALAKCNASRDAQIDVGANPNQPSVLWNAMIVPFLPMSIAGGLWYQAEQNVGEDQLYACLFPVMIADWRANFGSGYEFPFFFVQLAPWTGESPTGSFQVGLIRTAQLAALTQPSVGFASAVDLGDISSPFGDIHPRNKQEVCERLLKAALTIAYGVPNLVWQGPTFAAAQQSVTNMEAIVTVTFNTYGQLGLHYRPAVCPPSQPNGTCANWQIQMNDNNWYEANSASLSPNTNEVTVILANLPSTLTSVQAISYAYAVWPLTTIFSAENLPAIPFLYNF